MSSSWESKPQIYDSNLTRTSVYASRNNIQNKKKFKVKLSLAKRRTKIINYAHRITGSVPEVKLLTQMLMTILKFVYMNKETVNTRFHSTAMTAYITFSENLAGLYQTMMDPMMMMFNLEVVRKIFLFIYNIIFSFLFTQK